MAEIKDSYDAVVVGAGIAGLTCGAILAKNRRGVLVIEQSARPGGYCSSFEHAGYTFDRGLRFLTGCELGGAIYGALDELGLRDNIDFIKMKPSIRLIGSDYDFRMSAGEDLEDKLIELFPMEAPAIRRFTAECRRVASESERMSRKSPELMSIWQKLVFAIAFLFRYRRTVGYGRKSWQQVVEGFFEDPGLRAIALSIFSYFDPGVAARLPMMILGVTEDFYYPRGGAQALADVLADGVQRYDGDLALNTMVDSILIEDGRAGGVKLSDGRELKARHVISNVDARQTFLKLVGEEHLKPKFARDLNKARLSGSAFVVSLGVSLNLRAMGFDGANIVYNPSDDLDELFGADPAKCTVSINIHSILEPSQAPDSTTAVQLTAMLPYDTVEDWAAAEGAIADALIASAEKVIPRLSQHVICKHISSPLAFEQSTLNSRGASSGWYSAPGSKRRSQKTPIKNLYQAGQWTFPGEGVPAVVTSGRNAAQLVLRRK